MSAELDLSQYLDLFLQEADEQLEVLEQETLKLESDPTIDRLQVIFRAAHTLKGSSRAMGFTHMAEVTHEMENLLELLRSDKLPVTTEVADALFQCLDALSTIKTNIANGDGDALDVAELVGRLQSLSNQAGDNVIHLAEKPAEASAAVAAATTLSDEIKEALCVAAAEKPVLYCRVTLESECCMKWVRAFMVINAIAESGEILHTIPNQEALEEEQFDASFELYFHAEEANETLHKKLCAVSEVSAAELSVWTPDAIAETKAELEPQATQPESAVAETASPTPKASEAPSNQGSGKKTETGQTVRVDVARLDELMNLVGELVIDRTRVAQIGAVLSSRYEYDENLEALTETVSHISRITSDLQDQIMKARMLPIETVFNRFPRMMRDLAQKIGKEIKLEMEGGETELDRSVIEVIGDPLLHILRNSADHGIEAPADREKAGKPRVGTVTIAARHEENHIVIEIRDDGRGIDAEKVKAKAVACGVLTKEAADRMSEKEALGLIFHSGLSTAEQVSDVSGRGVGMDIVRSNLQKLGGIIDVDTTLGVGTRFSLRLPFTLAIIRGLLVKVAEVVYVIPLGSVIETLLVTKKDIQTVHRREVVVLRGVTTPLVRMREVFNAHHAEAPSSDESYVVIIGLADQRIGLVVDSLVGEQEVVIKSLSRFCGDVRGISGATILGDGNVALICDVNTLVNLERN